MAWIRAMGGAAIKYISNLIGLMAVTSPSNTTGDPATKRTFVKNTLVKGLAGNNWYNPNNITSFSQPATNAIKINAYNSYYGVGYVLPAEVTGGSNVSIDVSINNTSGMLNVLFYQSDGTFISSTALGSGMMSYTGTFPVPANAEYVVLDFIANAYYVDIQFTLNSISI